MPNAREATTAGVALAATTALAINLVLYAIGRAVGGTFTYRQSGKYAAVDAGAITILTLTSMVVGLVIALIALRRWPQSLPAFLGGAAVIAVGSIAVMTIPAHFDTTSTISLAAMHLSAIPIAVATLRSCAAPELPQQGDVAPRLPSEAWRGGRR